jgi:hypothetical protein
MSKTKLCFVASPIGGQNTPDRNHADWLFDEIIKPVIDEYPDYRVERADKITAPGMIDAQIINRLHDAELVIIDMTFQNANVFYEMGIRHMKRLPTIHMYRDGQEIPFDVQPYRAISFNYAHPNDLKMARSALKNVIDDVIKPDFVVDNPVTRARGLEKIEERATEFEKLMLQEISALRQQHTILESTVKHLILRGEQQSVPRPYLDSTMGNPSFPFAGRTTEAANFTTILASASNLEKPK